MARPCKHPHLVTLSLSLPPSQSWPYQDWSHLSSLSPLANSVHPPFILPRLDPGKEAWLSEIHGVAKSRTRLSG